MEIGKNAERQIDKRQKKYRKRYRALVAQIYIYVVVVSIGFHQF